ncbi:MAG: lipoyl(octanoyl) transferase LipB [Chloroflexi bacterium]|nr:lipoyl(octanoyl) transferase LipB [Chloroflexota bacterium]
MICHTIDLGTIAYQAAWDLQNRLAAEIARGERPATLLMLEHPHTFTFGRRGQAQNLLWDQATLEERGVTVHWVDRGGDVTYHGPGQLVGYPLLKLDGMDHVGYVRNLEKMLIGALARLGLVSGQISGKTGIWVQADMASRCPRCSPNDRQKPAKIAAIGVKVDANGITRHGFALNVCPEMDYFDGIIPCGIGDYPVISLADIFASAPTMTRVKQAIQQSFGEIFNLEIAETFI